MDDLMTDAEVLEQGVQNEAEDSSPNADDLETIESGGENVSDAPSEEESEDEQKVDGEEKSEIEQPNLFKGLKAKYPEIFKEFPDLRKEIALAQQITSVYPTVEAAKEAQETIQGFDVVRNAALSGDSKTILTEIAKADEGAAVKFATSFLPMLQQNAPQLYSQVTTPIVKQLLREIQNDAKNSKNQDLYYSVGHIAQRLFGSAAIPEDIAPNPEVETKKAELEKREQQFNSNVQSTFERGITVSAERRLSAAINAGLDPENVLSDRIKTSIANDTAEEIKNVLRNDKRYLATMQSLFKSAADIGYSPEASEKIINTFLARVKPLINPARQKVRSEYLQDKRNRDQINKPSKKAFIPPSGSAGSQKPLDPKRINYRETSDADILAGKITYKR